MVQSAHMDIAALVLVPRFISAIPEFIRTVILAIVYQRRDIHLLQMALEFQIAMDTEHMWHRLQQVRNMESQRMQRLFQFVF